MHLHIFKSSAEANGRAADLLASWLVGPGFNTLMVAAGNTPLGLYASVAAKKIKLPPIEVFVLDEYLGVPLDEPKNCSNLLRRGVAEAWGIPLHEFHRVSSIESAAVESIRGQEALIAEKGGLDAIVLGLGQNGHLGFNEPGSAADSPGRVLDLQPISVEANRTWFGGKYAPNRGVTTGLKTILAARKVLLLAFGAHKVKAVKAMVEGPVGPECPASFLQRHPDTHVFLDEEAAAGLSSR